jgi:hypothetical protein
MIGELVRKLEAGTITPADMGVLASALDHIERRSEILQGWIAPGASYPIISFAEIGRLKITEQILIDDGAPAISLEADGDAFFGSDISAPATTSLAIFSNAQTYNSEAMGAGDLLFGDNSASKANMLWDASAGKILFRGGATTQGYIDTDGSAVFGAGVVTINEEGLVIEPGLQGSGSDVKWRNANAFIGGIYCRDFSGTESRTELYASPPSLEGPSPSDLSLQASWYDDDNEIGSQQIFLGYDDIDSYFSPYMEFLMNSYGGSGLFKFRCSPRGTDSPTGSEMMCLQFEMKSDRDPAIHIPVLQWITMLTDITADSEDAYTSLMTLYDGALGTEVFRFDGTGIVFNDQGEAIQDFRVEGDTDANLLFCDAGADKVGIGDSAPGEKLDVAGNINATGVIKIDDVQVVGNRVVDARCDDTVNTSTWDSTTAGVLDALRDAMITHGLIAAA